MRTRQVLGHVLFWVVIMLAYAVSEWGYRDNFWEAILFELLYLPVRLAAVYFNWLVLIPMYLYRNKIVLYLFVLGTTLLSLAIIQRYFLLYWGYPVFFPDWMSDTIQPLILSRVFQALVIITSPVAFSTGIKIFIDWYKEKNRSNRLQVEKREAELKYLKAQINPHFLFNTLNNLYGLSVEKSEKVPSLILKLSNFLSFSLYGSPNDEISIGEEIQMVQDYIALEQDKFEERLAIDWDIDQEACKEKVAPLLFMPLIENAFKHGVMNELDTAKIEVILQKEADTISFIVNNSIARAKDELVSSGLGLTNLRRRLELLYPERHELSLQEQSNRFLARLTIHTKGVNPPSK